MVLRKVQGRYFEPQHSDFVKKEYFLGIILSHIWAFFGALVWIWEGKAQYTRPPLIGALSYTPNFKKIVWSEHTMDRQEYLLGIIWAILEH